MYVAGILVISDVWEHVGRVYMDRLDALLWIGAVVDEENTFHAKIDHGHTIARNQRLIGGIVVVVVSLTPISQILHDALKGRVVGNFGLLGIDAQFKPGVTFPVILKKVIVAILLHQRMVHMSEFSGCK